MDTIKKYYLTRAIEDAWDQIASEVAETTIAKHKEGLVLSHCYKMAVESLSPDDYQTFVDILNQLIATRHLKIDKFSREVLPYAEKYIPEVSRENK